MSTQAIFLVIMLFIFVMATGLLIVTRSIGVYRNRIAADSRMLMECRRQLSFLKGVRWFLWAVALAMVGAVAGAWYWKKETDARRIAETREKRMPVYDKNKVWEAPDPYLAETDAEAKLIAYGRDLIVNTQDYFGKNGLVRPASINAMNCQNCHLDAGSKPFGNNYFAVASTYPQMRARSGSLETISKRVNDCFERSLNGQPLDTLSREMEAIMAYIRWLGTGVPKKEKPKGSGIAEVPFLDRAADPAKGKVIFAEKCASCHGADGQGMAMTGGARSYPPLWGDNSYNEAAGLYRLSRFAGYVKANMPFGATYQSPQLSNEEAWDVAAFVNSQPRPKHRFLATDWPKIEKKPYDHPFGPYADPFPESRHKFGPFGEIVAYGK